MKQALTAAIGVSAPSTFVKLVALAKASGRDWQSLTSPLGFSLAGRWTSFSSKRPKPARDIAYPQTPAEMIPVATMNVDGVHYGFIARTPEIAAADYPVGECSPMDFDQPVYLLGATFADAIKNLASEQLKLLADEGAPAEDSQPIRRIIKALGINASARQAGRRYTKSGGARPVPKPSPIRSYLFKATDDGIGVHAPAKMFSGKAPQTSVDDPESALAIAAELLKSGSPASALVILKNLWWADQDPSIARPLIEAYRQLNRLSHAEAMKRRASIR